MYCAAAGRAVTARRAVTGRRGPAGNLPDGLHTILTGRGSQCPVMRT